MSKYIIEIAEEYEEYFKGVLICGIADGKFAVDVIAREDLEELNSDYINEHYGSLQDEAYKRGYEDAERIWRAPSSENEFYQKGFEDGKACDENGCKGCKWENKRGYEEPCKHCCNAYLNQYALIPKQDDSIKVGDEVTHKSDTVVWKAVCIQIDGDGRHMNLMGHTGAVGYYPVDDFKKTGRHFDISSILEAMRT